MIHDLLSSVDCLIWWIDLEKLAPQKNPWFAFDPYDWSSSLSLTFHDPNVINFTEAAMFVIKASNRVNLASMVLGWPWASLVANLLLVAPFPF